MTDGDPLRRFQRRVGFGWRGRRRLEEALTHRSHAHEQGLDAHYERLELLGDAVLGLLAAEWLFRRFPAAGEGRLSELKAYVVSRPVLARQAEELGIGELLRLGVGEERSGGRCKDSLLADAYESVLGALYLERGLERARRLVAPMFEEALERREGLDYPDAKTRLQELVQARGGGLPEYRHVAEEGPDHRKRFTVECWIDGGATASASGRSKKRAEQRAAAAALARLEGGEREGSDDSD